VEQGLHDALCASSGKPGREQYAETSFRHSWGRAFLKSNVSVFMENIAQKVFLL